MGLSIKSVATTYKNKIEMKEEKWIPLFTEEEIAALKLNWKKEEEIHPDSVYGQWMKRKNKEK